MSSTPNRRILLVDDNASIHEDFRKILIGNGSEHLAKLENARAAFFGASEATQAPNSSPPVVLDSAMQGMDGLELVVKAKQSGNPYAVAFVDIRMPPGWDGVRTIKEIWAVDPDLEVVICTAYNDYTWSETLQALGNPEKLLILKKPFDSVEIRQLASALTEKWNSAARERDLILSLQGAEAKARSYAASLETMNQALRASKATADKVSELRGAFLERLSFQMRSNLSAILDRVAVSGRSSELEDVLDQSTRLLKTMNEILDYKQLESGEFELDRTEVDVCAIVRGVVDSHREHATAKGLELECHIAPGSPMVIQADGARVRQVVEMLLDNALRYTPTGRVDVRVRLERGADWNSGTLRITICDTGPGLPEKHVGHIFEPLATGSSNGSGVGLALSKQLAKAMGGDLEYTSQPGQGCTFGLVLDTSQVVS